MTVPLFPECVFWAPFLLYEHVYAFLTAPNARLLFYYLFPPPDRKCFLCNAYYTWCMKRMRFLAVHTTRKGYSDFFFLLLFFYVCVGFSPSFSPFLSWKIISSCSAGCMCFDPWQFLLFHKFRMSPFLVLCVHKDAENPESARQVQLSDKPSCDHIWGNLSSGCLRWTSLLCWIAVDTARPQISINGGSAKVRRSPSC